MVEGKIRGWGQVDGWGGGGYRVKLILLIILLNCVTFILLYNENN